MICPVCDGNHHTFVRGTGVVTCPECCPYGYLHDIFVYEPDTGLLLRRRKSLKAKAGEQVGGRSADGYLVVNLEIEGKRKPFRVHRLIWMMQTGRWPECDIDHINRDRTDNRWENLRDVSRAENLRNNENLGVSWCKQTKRWRAHFSFENKSVWVGRFPTKGDAVKARSSAQEKFLKERRVG